MSSDVGDAPVASSGIPEGAPLSPGSGQPLPPSLDRLLIGRALGQYQVLEKIGQGGMGSVYRAMDTALERPVAIKVLFSNALVDDPKQCERFTREARSLARLTHPNLLHVYNVGSEENLHYFAMELLEGETISQAIRRRGRVPAGEVAFWLGQILSALHYVHRHGITHRDIKSGNIMLCDHRVVLMDFGLAKDEQYTGLTSIGAVLGTPDYMSPEAAEGTMAGPPTDLYSLGVVVYEALAGTLPFVGKSAMSIIRQHLDVPPPPLEQHLPDVDPLLAQIVHKCLAKKPEQRYPDCPALAQDLLKLYNTVELISVAEGTSSGASAVAKHATQTPGAAGAASREYGLPQPTLLAPLPAQPPAPSENTATLAASTPAPAPDQLTVLSSPEATVPLSGVPDASPRRAWGVWLWSGIGFFGMLLLILMLSNLGRNAERRNQKKDSPPPPVWSGQLVTLQRPDGSRETVRWIEFKAEEPDPAKWYHVIEQRQTDGSWKRSQVPHAELVKDSSAVVFEFPPPAGDQDKK